MLRGLWLRLKYWKRAKEGDPIIFLECHACNFDGAADFITKAGKSMEEWQLSIKDTVKTDAFILLVSKSR